jgi:hypothetical protein
MNVITNFFAPSKTQYYRVEGKVDFFVEVTETKGLLPLNTASVVVRAFSNKDKTLQLPMKIKWYKLQAERNYEIEELENKDCYDFSALDVGGEVKASLRSMDEKFKGIASVIFGPIRFDDKLRQALESVLLSGFSKFNVMVQDDELNGPDKVQPISVFMSPNQVKFFYYTNNDEESFYVEITSDLPRLQVVHTDSKNLLLYFNEVGFENNTKPKLKLYKKTEDVPALGDSETIQEKYCVHLRFFSRDSRDIFVTAVRLFRIVPVVGLSNLFRQIDVLLRENRLFEGNGRVTLNELLVEHDMLRSNLLSVIEYAKDLDADREELQRCTAFLEKDLEHTMTEFRKYIEENMRGVPLAKSGTGKADLSIGLKKFDELNASLLSNKGEMKMFIKKKLDETSTNLHEKSLKTSAELEKLKNELDNAKKLNNVYAKKIKELQESKAKKKDTVAKALKEINQHMNNVSREVNNFNQIAEQIKDTSRMQSQMFDVSGIESKNDEEDMFHSNPFNLGAEKVMQKKKAPAKTEILSSNLFQIEEKAELEKDKLSSSLLNSELKAKDETINSLKAKVKELERTLLDQQTRLNTSASKKAERSMETESSNARIMELMAQLSVLKTQEAELKTEATKGANYIEEFRALMKAVVADDESTLKPPMNSSLIDESLMNDVFKVNLNTKLKMLDIENENLKKRTATLTKEVFLLREENRQLRIDSSKTSGQFSTFGGLPPGALSKEEHDQLRRELDGVTLENENLRAILGKMKDQDQHLNVNETVKALKKEIGDLAAVNQSLLAQKLELSKKNEQMKNQVTDRREDRRDEAEERKEKLIIDQLTKTNERLMTEIARLEEKILQYDEARQSFISDMNDSYLSQSFRGDASRRFK